MFNAGHAHRRAQHPSSFWISEIWFRVSSRAHINSRQTTKSRNPEIWRNFEKSGIQGYPENGMHFSFIMWRGCRIIHTRRIFIFGSESRKDLNLNENVFAKSMRACVWQEKHKSLNAIHGIILKMRIYQKKSFDYWLFIASRTCRLQCELWLKKAGEGMNTWLRSAM